MNYWVKDFNGMPILNGPILGMLVLFVVYLPGF